MKLSFFFTVILTMGFFVSCISLERFEIDFTSQSDFDLDSSSHELLVTTKQEKVGFSALILKGDTSNLSLGKVVESDFIKEYNGFSVKYCYNSKYNEIYGEWFTIKKKDNYTISITVDENNEGKSREFVLELVWMMGYNNIKIKQDKK